LSLREKKKLDRFSIIALAAVRLALRSVSSNDPKSYATLEGEGIRNCGIFVGNASAGWTFTEPELRKLHSSAARIDSISPYLATAWFPAAPQGLISIQLGLHGFAKTIATDRCAGSQAVGLAFDQIKLGRCAMAIAGGVEAPLTPFVKAGFRTKAERDNLAEGGSFLIMQASSNGRGVFVTGHRTLLRMRNVPRLAGLSRWISQLPIVRCDEDHPPLVVCTVAPHSQDEDITAIAVWEAFHVEPELPLRSAGDALAASAAASIGMAVSRLESSQRPRSAAVVCVGPRYVHALTLCAN
jgi:hypothetical protein